MATYRKRPVQMPPHAPNGLHVDGPAHAKALRLRAAEDARLRDLARDVPPYRPPERDLHLQRIER